MSDTRKWAYDWTEDDRIVRREMSLEEQIACLEIDLRLVKEAYRERVAALEALMDPKELERLARERFAGCLI